MNARVNYPVKRILNALVNDENIDIDDEATKFCVSWVTSRVCQVGSQQVIDAWNNHPIPGKPDSLYSINQPLFLVHILKLLFLLFSYYTAFLNINDAFNIVHTYNLCTRYFIFLCMYISVMKETSPCT